PVAGLWFVLLTMAMLGWLSRSSAPGPQLQFATQTLQEVSGSDKFQFVSEPLPAYIGKGGKLGAKTTLSLASMSVADNIRGYAGPLNLLVAVDFDGVLQGVKYVNSHETPSYIQGLQPWLDTLLASNPAQSPLSLQQIDALSGATVTSKAALATINLTAREGLRQVLNRSWPQPPSAINAQDGLFTPKVFTLTVLLLLLLPVYLWGGKLGRTLFQIASLIFLGFVFNLLLTEVDIANLGLGHFSTWEANPAWWILAVTALLLTPLFGQIYCGMLCPFGVLQEFVSRLGRMLNLGLQPQNRWEVLVRFGKFVLLALVLSLVWLTGEGFWISFNPMQQFFTLDMDGSILAIAVCSLVGALFFFRFWCRYFCPLGAFFALGNKLAFLDRLAPKRRFNRCDLGVSHNYDTDCIRCDRCTHEPATKKPPTPPHTKKLFFGILAIMTILIINHIHSEQQKQTQATGGWRKIDVQKLKTQIGTTRLSNKEAQWWRVEEGGD
ncbi:MAG: 4Fe-4S binding protein, partial [Magnetococcales bacterium]|nr:4Fe-4S binding protein [Magnetococcales bacterium]